MDYIKVKLDEGAYVPLRAHKTDAGMDLRALWDYDVPAHGSSTVLTGVHVELPHGYAGLLVSKSGLNIKKDITTTGLIDEGFTGEIKVNVQNHSDHDYHIEAGDKVTQLVVFPVLYLHAKIVDEINGGGRGEKGYGSSGK
jgi:dUTP pyrophosphatase